jgi:hypothetical protein
MLKAQAVEAAWAAFAGASACLGGLIDDRSGVLADSIDEPELTQVRAALGDGRAARDELADALHREALQAGVALFEMNPNRDYATLLKLRVVIRDGLAGADGLADVLTLDDGELVRFVSRLRDGFQAVADALPPG